MREAADLLRIKQNTFRHHVSNLEGCPEGILEGGNRRSFSAEKMVEARRVLLETAGSSPVRTLTEEPTTRLPPLSRETAQSLLDVAGQVWVMRLPTPS
jgi:hypothetical protein